MKSVITQLSDIVKSMLQSKTLSANFATVIILLTLITFISGCKKQEKNDVKKTDPSNQMVYLNVENMSLDERNAAMVVQGLVNRDRPLIYLFNGKHNMWGQFIGAESHGKKFLSDEFLAKYRTTEDLFEELYIQKRGFVKRELKSLNELFEEFLPHAKGAVLYDLNRIDQRVVAFSFASAEDYLPVTKDLLVKYPILSKLSVRENLIGKFEASTDLQEWAYDLLSSKCNKKGISSYWEHECYMCIDHGVSLRTYFFNLATRPTSNIEEYKLLLKMLKPLDVGAVFYGWSRDGEDSILSVLGKVPMHLQCDPAPNLSFHRAVKPISSTAPVMPPSKRTFDPQSLKLQNKYYLTFMINEGDTLKCMGTLMNGGQWAWAERGQVPINWGMNPWIVENYPGMMELFYESMTEKDLFYSVVGYGYYNPKLSPGFEHLMAEERRTNPLGHLTTGCVYSVYNMFDATNGVLDERSDRWLVGRGCEGYAFVASQETSLKFSSKLQPLIGTDWQLFYWRFRFNPGIDPLKGAVDRIQELAAQNEPPFLIPVYAGSPAEFKQIADALPKDKFEVVLLDEMVELAKRIGETQLSQEKIDLKGEKVRPVTLTLRQWAKTPRSGVVTVKAPSGWKVTPDSWKYEGLESMQVREQMFQISGPTKKQASVAKIVFSDSGSGRETVLTVQQTGAPAPIVKAPEARRVIAGYGTPVIDGTGKDWEQLSSQPVEQDLELFKIGSFKAQYRWAWDEKNLYMLIEEKRAPQIFRESVSAVEFCSGDFWKVNAASFWFDFSGSGTTEHGDFAPRFGFSSTGVNEFYTCTINNRILVTPRPKATVATSGTLGNRVIEASIPWSELDVMLKEEHKPFGGFSKVVKNGYGFSCQPQLAENLEHQGCLNGFSRTFKPDCTVLEKKQEKAGPPTGKDKDSLWIELGRKK